MSQLSQFEERLWGVSAGVGSGNWITWDAIPSWLTELPYWIIQRDPEPFAPRSPTIDRRDIAVPDPQIPVGLPDVQPPPPEPRVVLPNLVIAERPVTEPDALPGTTIGEPVPLSDAEWYENLFGRPSIPPGPALPAELELHIPETPVTDFFHDLGDVVVDIARDTFLPGADVVTNLNPTTTVTPTIPGAPAAPSGACGTGASPVYKQVCGVWKWVYPKRRRRRALLTEGDYNALLRIENLKVNKNMSVAIAKALTR